MAYSLRDDLSFCVVDGHPIFLDVQNDRYFRLSTDLERAFISYISPGGGSNLDTGLLLKHRILIIASSEQEQDRTPLFSAPCRSALEEACNGALSIVTLLEVFALVCFTQLQLKMRPLKSVLGGLAKRRRNRAPDPANASSEQSLLAATARFERARMYVPLPTTCLLDSVALMKFLARHHLCANLVFAVSAEPFTAHCWVQSGDLALNETVGDANAHTPIRVV